MNNNDNLNNEKYMIKIYPLGFGNSPYIGQIKIHEDTVNNNVNNNEIETIIIIDVSGSMGQNVGRLFNNYLPMALTKAGYNNNDNIKVITFSSNSRVCDYTITSLKYSRQIAESSTYMTNAIINLSKIIESSKKDKFRIMTISDGVLNDQIQTINESNKLVTTLKKYNKQINSTAIRLYTSLEAQPDTRGLSSVLQFTTIDTSNMLIDINLQELEYSTEIVSDMIANLLRDNLGVNLKLVIDNNNNNNNNNNIISIDPWGKQVGEVSLENGTNIFWLSSIPENIKIISSGNVKSNKIKIRIEDEINSNNYNNVLKKKINYYLQKLRILKVVGTTESYKEIELIINYFQQLEKYYLLKDTQIIDLRNETGLKSRLTFFKNMVSKKQQSIALKMLEIANDNKVSILNSSQQADYLRSTETTSNSKSLAKRGIKQGLDFDIISREQVREMKKHIHELDNINDENHYRSFYSCETTLGGIRTVCELVDELDTIDDMNALEILQLLNIVGIPCERQIGDFPDPKTYHTTELFLGTFVSMSDVLICKEHGNVLRDPFKHKEIINVIPFYDDDRIQEFLMKYAPTLLEYTASLGMRNMIVDIPHTYKYTVVDGVYNMSSRITKEKSSVNINIFMKLIRTYKMASNGLFDYVMEHIKEQSEEDKKNNLAYYIVNNGTTNMISPLITIMEESIQMKSDKIKYIPNILRTLFAFEIHQVVRKFFRTDSDGYLKRKEMFDNLLGIDYEKYGVKVGKYFEEIEPVFHNQIHINNDIYNQICKTLHWLNNVAILPEYIYQALRGDDGKNIIMNMGELTNDIIKEKLNINFDVDKFKLYCIAQSFIYDTKAYRVDDENHKMKIIDCGNQELMDKMISDYIVEQYKTHYQSQLEKKRLEEHNILSNELVSDMVYTNNINEFINLFKNGKQRGLVNEIIKDTSSIGFIKLRNLLFDPATNVPLRLDKLKNFILGCDQYNNIIWNKGNVLRMSLISLKQVFQDLNLEDSWNEISSIYKNKNIHIYRNTDKINRHSHNNEKISYWALGYKNLGDYFANIDIEQQKQYLLEHSNCCGIQNGVVYRWA